MSSAHVSTSDVESDPEGMAETYGQFAVDGRNPALIEPLISSGWDSEEGVIENAERINAAADLMADHDFKFGYHNHDFEFQYLDEEEGLRAYDVFIEHIEEHVNVQLDVAWVYAGVDRPDPVHYITEYGDKIGTLHMKNWTTNGKQLTEIHKGDLDMHEIADAARKHSKVDHLVYEYDSTPTPYHSFEYARMKLDWVNERCNPVPRRQAD
jgi:sugar phosphate isomerase/epimerase